MHAVSLEHKLGIHGSPTCTLAYGDKEGAVGYLVGRAQPGHRIHVCDDERRPLRGQPAWGGSGRAGLSDGPGHAEERVQGKVLGQVGLPHRRPPGGAAPKLPSMRTRIFAMRALVYGASAWFDHARHNPDVAVAEQSRRYIDLLMPVLKAWNTEVGNIVCDDAIQVFGGWASWEETGITQHYRDSRVTRI